MGSLGFFVDAVPIVAEMPDIQVFTYVHGDR
jgi:hypothetical protein